MDEHSKVYRQRLLDPGAKQKIQPPSPAELEAMRRRNAEMVENILQAFDLAA
jgi:hypothetical protein